MTVGVRTRVGEEMIRARPFADRWDEGAGPASPSSTGGSWCLVEERACKRSEGRPVKAVGRAQYYSEHPVKWVEVDEVGH